MPSFLYLVVHNVLKARSSDDIQVHVLASFPGFQPGTSSLRTHHGGKSGKEESKTLTVYVLI